MESTMANDKTVWVVRAGNNNEIAQEVEEQSAVALGWAVCSSLPGSGWEVFFHLDDDLISKRRQL